MTRSTAFFLLALAASACVVDGDDGDSKHGDATYRAANTAVQSGLTTLAPGDVSDVASSCAGGGSITFSGSFGATTDYALSASFEGCAIDDLVLSGDLELSGSVEAGADGSHVVQSIDGHLEVTGAFTSSCDLSIDTE
ncbi:MAG TPA: hypothetical protein VG755_34560, partial [Nannocystaceae bacterium]|nr:hypothetical protein [Nannocystaceae bacterium]